MGGLMGPVAEAQRWRTAAERLMAAIEHHRDMVTGPGPAEDFGACDDWLYEEARTIMRDAAP